MHDDELLRLDERVNLLLPVGERHRTVQDARADSGAVQQGG